MKMTFLQTLKMEIVVEKQGMSFNSEGSSSLELACKEMSINREKLIQRESKMECVH